MESQNAGLPGSLTHVPRSMSPLTDFCQHHHCCHFRFGCKRFFTSSFHVSCFLGAEDFWYLAGSPPAFDSTKELIGTITFELIGLKSTQERHLEKERRLVQLSIKQAEGLLLLGGFPKGSPISNVILRCSTQEFLNFCVCIASMCKLVSLNYNVIVSNLSAGPTQRFG